MLTGLDHAIIALRSLDSAQPLGQRLGLVVSPGGEHPGRGTHNAIVRFGSDYLEMIAVSAEEQARADPDGQVLVRHLTLGEGWLGFALSSDDIDGDVALARARGLAIEDPADGERTRPDGVTLRWRRARVPDSRWGGRLPFLIQHADWSQVRNASEPPVGHPIGVSHVASVTVATADLESLAGDYARLLGVESPVPEMVPEPPSLRVSFRVGALDIRLSKPTTTTGDLAGFVDEWGGGLYLATLAVRDLRSAVDYLNALGVSVRDSATERRALLADRTQSAGARIDLVETTPARSGGRPAGRHPRRAGYSLGRTLALWRGHTDNGKSETSICRWRRVAAQRVGSEAAGRDDG